MKQKQFSASKELKNDPLMFSVNQIIDMALASLQACNPTQSINIKVRSRFMSDSLNVQYNPVIFNCKLNYPV